MSELSVSNGSTPPGFPIQADAARFTGDEKGAADESFLAVLVRSLEMTATGEAFSGDPSATDKIAPMSDAALMAAALTTPPSIPPMISQSAQLPPPSFLGAASAKDQQTNSLTAVAARMASSSDGDGTIALDPSEPTSSAGSSPKKLENSLIIEHAEKHNIARVDERFAPGAPLSGESHQQSRLQNKSSEPFALDTPTTRLRTDPSGAELASPATNSAVQAMGFHLNEATTRSVQGPNGGSNMELPHHYQIHTSIKTPEWPIETGQIIRIMTHEKISEAQIRVNPPELGPIDVIVKQDGDATSIAFSSHSADTRALLESHIPRLREAMDAAGLHLTEASVNSGGSQRDPRSNFNGYGNHRQLPPGVEERLIGSSHEVVMHHDSNARSNRLIDIFA
jgi:flagellar hook-length control protein FliK